MEKTERTLTIRCPICNYEYLPGEIYDPKTFVGQPKDILRDDNGNIDNYYGLNQNIEEKFICEKCNKPFIIRCKMSFETEYNIKEDFDDEYSVPIYENRISLTEDLK